ncbi:hypothetical protein N9L94_04555 [Robiginitalea sp.]|nr:hypothetical protein [Robiginitalea sp.]
MKKSWTDKFNAKSNFEIKVLEKAFWGHEVGDKMLIPSPAIIQDYINEHDAGIRLELNTMRDDLALTYGADFTCPLTTGIFLRIVAEMNHEQYAEGASLESICPFWRIIEPQSKLAGKLSFGTELIRKMRHQENIDLK